MPPKESLEAGQSTSMISVAEIHEDIPDDTLDGSPLEKLSATIFETVQQARSVIAMRDPDTVRPRFTALRPGNYTSAERSVNRQRLDEAILASDRVFRQIGSQVQMLLYSASFYHPEPGTVAETTEHFRNVNESLIAWITAIRELINTPDKELEAIDRVIELNTVVKGWEATAQSMISRGLPALGNEEGFPSSSSAILPLATEVATNGSATSRDVILPSICPIEAAIKRTLPAVVRTCSEFAAWACSTHGLARTTNQEVGTVQSVQLFREQGVIHHEFVLICFGGAGVVSSWVRFERAARIKNHWHRVQLDSSGPVVGGATLRETVTYSISKEALITPKAERLGFVSRTAVTDAKASTPLNNEMLLAELGHQLQVTSGVYPKYKLFSANCRWFARRILLNFAQRLVVVAPFDNAIWWAEQQVSYGELYKKLKKEPFGGDILEGQHGALVKKEATSIRRAY
ncbi:hypothetical protein DL93DRAFT_2172695 [Clavulina sp. PMI_390]|nr:hypothetical protein DL93DRAFT_2172695 [Clavulina sp. PMI_390]